MTMIDTTKLHELTADEFAEAHESVNKEWDRLQQLLTRLRGGVAQPAGQAAATSGATPPPAPRAETRGRPRKAAASVHDLNTRAGQFAQAAEQLDDTNRRNDSDQYEQMDTDEVHSVAE